MDDCPDRVVVLDEAHPRAVLREHGAYDHTARPHRRLGLAPPPASEGRPPDPSLLYGAAGEGLFLLRLWEATHDGRYLAAAGRLGAWLDAVAERTARGCWWPWPGVGGGGGLSWPGQARGAAGIGVFLVELHRVTGAARWAAVVREVGRTLTAWAQPDGPGLAWPPALDAAGAAPAWAAPRPELALQWCTGAAGIGCFLARGAAALGDAALLATAEAAGEAVSARGDLRRGPGQCHGLAGSVELFLALHRATGAARWRARAHEFAAAAFAARTATPDGDLWPTETPDRASPDLMCGAAGIGLAFLRVLAPEDVQPALG